MADHVVGIGRAFAANMCPITASTTIVEATLQP